MKVVPTWKKFEKRCGSAFRTCVVFTLTCCVGLKGVLACLEQRGVRMCVCHGWLYRRLILAFSWDVDCESFIPLASPVRRNWPVPKFPLSTPWMHVWGSRRVTPSVLLNSALDGGGWLTSCSGRFTPRNNSCTHWMGGWVRRRAGWDVSEQRKKIFCPYRYSNFGVCADYVASPARGQHQETCFQDF